MIKPYICAEIRETRRELDGSLFFLPYVEIAKILDDRQIRKLAEKGLETLEYADCFITEIKVVGNKIEVFLDSDEGISFLKCRKVSREIEAVIDEKEWWGGKYTLDVSSAGIGRPLVSRRQYPKNIGRKIEVKTIGGEKVKGVLSIVAEEGISLSYEVIEREGKKKKKIEKIHPIKWDEIKESKIKASF